MSTLEELDEINEVSPASPLKRKWFLYLLALLVVGLGFFGAGFGLAQWQQGVDNVGPEATFARQMMQHHAQAVDMATILRDRTSNQALRTLTLDIMLTQQAQIGQMQGWLAAWKLPLSAPVPPTTPVKSQTTSTTPMEGMSDQSQMAGDPSQMPGMATQAEINRLGSLPQAEAEVAFLQLMIRHHRGGVTMARKVLGQTSRPEVTRLAQAIVQSQESEISYMQDLLRQRGVSTGA